MNFWFVEATRFSFEFRARRRSNPKLPQLELGLEWQLTTTNVDLEVGRVVQIIQGSMRWYRAMKDSQRSAERR